MGSGSTSAPASVGPPQAAGAVGGTGKAGEVAGAAGWAETGWEEVEVVAEVEEMARVEMEEAVTGLEAAALAQ